MSLIATTLSMLLFSIPRRPKKYVGLASADGDILESVFKNANEMYEDGTVM